MADETKSLKMDDINEALSDYKLQNLEGVILEEEIEIEMDLCSCRIYPMQWDIPLRPCS